MNRRQLLAAAAAVPFCSSDTLTERQRQLLLLSHLPPPETWEDYERERVFDTAAIAPDVTYLESLGLVRKCEHWRLDYVVTATEHGTAYLRRLGLA